MIAYHFIKENRRSGVGNRRAYVDGKVEHHRGSVEPCVSGLHASPTPWDALQYAPGPLLSLVEIPDDALPHGSPVDKYVASWRRRIFTIDISKELRLFACDVAEEALNREVQCGNAVDERSRAAIEVARRYAQQQATEKELAAAPHAARGAALAAAWGAALATARGTGWAAGWAVAEDVHKQRFNALMQPLFAEAMVPS